MNLELCAPRIGIFITFFALLLIIFDKLVCGADFFKKSIVYIKYTLDKYSKRVLVPLNNVTGAVDHNLSPVSFTGICYVHN